jgi:hypothetical protein
MKLRAIYGDLWLKLFGLTLEGSMPKSSVRPAGKVAVRKLRVAQ